MHMYCEGAMPESINNIDILKFKTSIFSDLKVHIPPHME